MGMLSTASLGDFSGRGECGKVGTEEGDETPPSSVLKTPAVTTDFQEGMTVSITILFISNTYLRDGAANAVSKDVKVVSQTSTPILTTGSARA